MHAYFVAGNEPIISIGVHDYITFILPGFIFHTAWSFPRRCNMLVKNNNSGTGHGSRQNNKPQIPLRAVALFCTLVSTVASNFAWYFVIFCFKNANYLGLIILNSSTYQFSNTHNFTKTITGKIYF